MLSVKIKPHLRDEVISLLWSDRLEVEAPCCFESEETSLKKVEGVTEFALNTQEVRKVYQTFMMIEVPLQEVNQLSYIVCGLDPLKLLL